ncbi:tetratricopeptide repeat protein [Bacteroides sp. 519]|uniref:tetratricopeptide repeat protein n=1 Tax=Bacteroides sp. 519 TaxID=2302937 RepID=UPI0013D88BB7|nr:tetratricopeptide repeat protein [Bacteroides sp. 519]NDV59158.1 tetratricopeptide repeat protein [Bacteroides sp. 519]
MNLNPAQLIAHPELLNRETLYELRTLLARYPYCQSLRLLFLKNLYILNDISFGDELQKSVLYIGDRRTLFYLIEGDKIVPLSYKTHPLLNKVEKEPAIDRTFALIDAFLSTIPAEEEENKPVDNFQYISDYTSLLEDQEPEEEDTVEEVEKPSQLRGQNLIDNFITKAETESIMVKPLEKQPLQEEDYEEDTSNSSSLEGEEDETFFTETLAKIYIKQQRYTKALEIIKKLSLKYPKKNAYFADQIRFLEKLIINAKSK